MLNFNERGYLIPFEATEIEVGKAKSAFTFNEHRTIIWSDFEDFILELQNMLKVSFSIWVDGSFTTVNKTGYAYLAIQDEMFTVVYLIPKAFYN